MRYRSKDVLLDDIRTEHDVLCARLAEIPNARWHELNVWGDGWTLSDLVAHLAEWQHMFLGWYEDGLRGATPEMPAPGYKWSQTPRLNRAIWEKHRSRSQAAVRADLDSGYRRIVHIVEALSPEQLLEPGHYEWTGKYPLTTYIGPNTASHYRFAIKAITRWLKGTAGADTSVARPDKRVQPTKARVGRRTEQRGRMSPSAFLDRGTPPGERALEAVLGKGHGLWAALRADLSSEFAPLSGKWSFSGKSHGWILQLRQKQRTVLYMVPCPGYFVASFALGEKACQAAHGSRLPTQVLEIIQHAPKYPEGRGVRFEVRNKKDLANVEALASIKMANQ